MKCAADSCERDREALTYCNMHYKRFKRNGDANIARRRRGLIRNDAGQKMCVRCREWLPESSFGTNANNVDKLGSYCRPCCETYQRLRKFGLSAEQYDAMLLAQGGCCAICQSESSGPRGWHVDHDHKCCPPPPGRKSFVTCGECVRGLLCHSCNLAIGGMKDSASRLRAAADYLDRAAVTRSAR